MKKTITFFLLLVALSALSGFLMSKASWIGRVGMTFFHKEYNLLKIWWQGAMAVFIVVTILFLVQAILNQKLRNVAAKVLHFMLLAAAVAGLYLTYEDFTNDFSHRVLGRRFHYGFYLIWIEWMLVCLFFLFKKKTTKTTITSSDKTELVTQ